MRVPVAVMAGLPASCHTLTLLYFTLLYFTLLSSPTIHSDHQPLLPYPNLPAKARQQIQNDAFSRNVWGKNESKSISVCDLSLVQAVLSCSHSSTVTFVACSVYEIFMHCCNKYFKCLSAAPQIFVDLLYVTTARLQTYESCFQWTTTCPTLPRRINLTHMFMC